MLFLSKKGYDSGSRGGGGGSGGSGWQDRGGNGGGGYGYVSKLYLVVMKSGHFLFKKKDVKGFRIFQITIFGVYFVTQNE